MLGFDAWNHLIRLISVRACMPAAIVLCSDGWQVGCSVDCARALEDRAMPCRIGPGRAVGAILGDF